MTEPRFHIDKFSRLERVIQVAGWCDLKTGDLLAVSLAGVAGSVVSTARPDLVEIFGAHASSWGFDAVIVFDSNEKARQACKDVLVLKSPEKEIAVSEPATRFGGYHHQAANDVELAFFEALRNHSAPTVLELGSRARSGISRRDRFGSARYVGLDIMPGENVDLVGDVHRLSSLTRQKFDFVFSVSVFEHLMMPWKVAVELAKRMNRGGLIFVYSHQAWPIHDAPWDFWRFSCDSWDAIFNHYTGFEIVMTGYKEPCLYATYFDDGNPVTDFQGQKGYYAVTCLAKRIGPPKLDWNISPADIVQTSYPV